MTKTAIYITALVIFFLVSMESFADTIDVVPEFTYISLGPRLEYLCDPSGNLAIHNVLGPNPKDAAGRPLRWLHSDRTTLGFGFTSMACWVRYTLRNGTDSDITSYLNQNYPLISHIDFYSSDGAVMKETRTGHRYDFFHRPLHYRTFVFPVTVKAKGETVCYLRFSSESALIIDLGLYAPDVFKTKNDREAAFFWMFYGILLIMVLYHFILLFTVKDLGYLYYICAIGAMLVLDMGLNGISYQFFWPHSVWWERYNNPTMIGISYALFLQFGRYYTELRRHMPRADIVLRLFIALSFIAGLSTLVIQNYRFSMIATTTITFVTMFYNIYILLFLTFVKKSRTARSFLMAVSILMVGVILYILKTYGAISDNIITAYSLQAGWVAMVTLLSLGLADRINTMRLQIEDTQRKYIQLLESSNDIIFNLDENLRFITVNRAIQKHLGYQPDEVLGTSLLDHIDRNHVKDGGMYLNFFNEYISGLGKDKETISFRTGFRAKFGTVPIILSVKLDYIETDGKGGIFGTASIVSDDIILSLLRSERQVYWSDNNFSHAEFLSQRLVKNLGKYLDQAGIQGIKISLMEIIINAIEHGNLDIQFSEKSNAVAGHSYLQFVRERQKDPRYADKKITIEYSLTAAQVAYRISDEGKGFDHRSVMNLSPDNINKELLTHGRGLILARNAFDVVSFNDTGNQVLLIKYFSGPTGETPQF